MNARPAAFDLVSECANTVCHMVCGIYTDRTLCGVPDRSTRWCAKDPCPNACLVCDDLDVPGRRCPVCGTNCAPVVVR